MLASQLEQGQILFPFVFGMIVLGILWVVISILLCIWVYRDAQSRRMDGVLWLIVVLIANIVGLIIYLIVREEKRLELPAHSSIRGQTRFCSNCGLEISPDANFCPNCGRPITR